MCSDRHIVFGDEHTKQVLWKDARIDEWLKIRDSLHEYIGDIGNLCIESETEILSRILFKHSNQMRRGKSFQYVKKVQKLSSRYCQMNLLPDLKKFHSTISKLKGVGAFSQYALVPAYKFIEYLIKKVIDAIQLCLVMIVKCQEAARYLYAHMKHGFFVQFNTFAIATTSKLWCLYKETFLTLKRVYVVIHEAISKCCLESCEYPKCANDLIDVHPMLPMDIKLSLQNNNEKYEEETPLKFEIIKEKQSDDFGEPVSMEELKALRTIQNNLRTEDPPSTCCQENTSRKVTKKRRKVCPACNEVLRVVPSLRRSFKTRLHRTFIRKHDPMNLRHVVHDLLHSNDVSSSRLLIFRYKHLHKLKIRRKLLTTRKMKKCI